MGSADSGGSGGRRERQRREAGVDQGVGAPVGLREPRGRGGGAAEAFEGAASWAASPSTIGGGRRRRRPAAVVVFLDECDSLVSSSGVVAATLAAILDGMEGGGGAAGWDRSSGERDGGGERSGWERVIVVAATNRADAIPDYLRRPGRLEREVVVRPPDLGGRYELLRGMLLGASAAGGRRDDGDPAATDADADADGDECDGCDDEAGLWEVADAANLPALVRRAATLGAEVEPEWIASSASRERKRRGGISVVAALARRSGVAAALARQQQLGGGAAVAVAIK